MKNIIQIQCPQELLLGLHFNAESFADYMKEQAAISLFKEGKISSGMAATWLAIGRVEFLRRAFNAGAVLLENSADDVDRETSLL